MKQKILLFFGLSIYTSISFPSLAQVPNYDQLVKMKRYRELKKNEVFIGILDQEEFKQVGWPSKRNGYNAYSENGDPLPKRYFPVFADIEQVKKFDNDTTYKRLVSKMRLVPQKK